MMPYKENIIKRKYYTIGQVADMFSLATSNLRYYDSEFPWLKVKRHWRTRKRQYVQADINEVSRLYLAIERIGMTFDGVRQANSQGYLDDYIQIYVEHQLDLILDKHKNLFNRFRMDLFEKGFAVVQYPLKTIQQH